MTGAPSRVRALAERLYPDYQTESDLLHEVITHQLPESGRVLDVGCGGGELFPHDYRSDGRPVIGLDLDPALVDNPLLDAAVWGSVDAMPFDDATFDLIYSRYVLEHLPEPEATFAEVARVLRPGGTFVVLTPNRRHYVSIIARLTPHVFHRAFNASRGRAEEDTFPTLYRANSRGKLRALARSAGLREAEARMIETRPNYLMFSVPTFLMGVAYERMVSATSLLAGLRVNILATYEKPFTQDEVEEDDGASRSRGEVIDETG